MESRMRRKSHVRFGERDGETHSPQDEKVRSVPTLRATYYLKPDETEAPEDLAAKGVLAVRGVIADTGEMILPAAETTAEGEETGEA